ncbi:hypothetical protein D3C78_1543380 [compost metagenome]
MALSTRLPYVPLRLPAVTAAPSAPCTSLVMTLPIRLRLFSLAVFGLVSFTAVGTSSTICTLRVLLVVSLSLSTNVTVKSSNRLLLPLAVGCVSLSSRL